MSHGSEVTPGTEAPQVGITVSALCWLSGRCGDGAFSAFSDGGLTLGGHLRGQFPALGPVSGCDGGGGRGGGWGPGWSGTLLSGGSHLVRSDAQLPGASLPGALLDAWDGPSISSGKPGELAAGGTGSSSLQGRLPAVHPLRAAELVLRAKFLNVESGGLPWVSFQDGGRQGWMMAVTAPTFSLCSQAPIKGLCVCTACRRLSSINIKVTSQ